MAVPSHPAVKNVFERYAQELTSHVRQGQLARANPEDQLKRPVSDMIEGLAAVLGMSVHAITEVQVRELHGRPDIGVTVKGLIVGHIELKAPDRSARPQRFTGADKAQWEKFKDLPNLIYTNGSEWALFRSGQPAGSAVRFQGDVTTDGKNAVTDANVGELLKLLQDFLLWEPIVPSTPKALAELLAPLCRLLRQDVAEALKDPDSDLSLIAKDWRKYLFPDADDGQFADAYAQTLTYALLLARVSNDKIPLTVMGAVEAIRPAHRLLADILKIMGDPAARAEIDTSIQLIERVIAAVNPAKLAKSSQGDLWLYFYEDFLAAYDPAMRKDYGVYYTPVEVVQAQVHLVTELLEKHFSARYGFASQNVTTIDPAAGTGTYILAALEHGLDLVTAQRGAGMRKSYAKQTAENLYAFELLVGSYSVAHLRLTQAVLAAGGELPRDGVHVYLTDTLESPNNPPGSFGFMYKELGEEHRRALHVKKQVPIMVCMGNPPYDRQQLTEEQQKQMKRKGGWIRYGDEGVEGAGILRDFLAPLAPLGLGLHAKNLYNDYVYFWRWALWKVFESKTGPGVVCFITASSYLRGPGFAGMRQMMRQALDDLWIIDLEGDNLGARKSENVFAIRTPVAIAVAVRYGNGDPTQPARVRYTRLEGQREDKLKQLDEVKRFADLNWRDCTSGWTEPFLPISDKAYWDWPLLTDLFPWQENGMQYKRTWPIAESPEVLRARWRAFLQSGNKGAAFRETGDRKITGSYPPLGNHATRLPALASLPVNAPAPTIQRIAYRSLDRQWAFVDARFGDRLRPALHLAHSDRQLYFTSLLTNVLGIGPALVAAALLPDLHHFSGRGAKDVIPLWRDQAATKPNVAAGLLDALNAILQDPVSADDLFCYCYALLATPKYVELFWDELTIPGPRVPITQDIELFRKAADLGRRLIWLHTYGERYVPEGMNKGVIPPGRPRCKIGTSQGKSSYPKEYRYDPATNELYVGDGVFERVRPELWEYSVSGFPLLKSWLGYRMQERAGKASSPLDAIRPESWTFDDELLDLLWVLDATIDMAPALDRILAAVLESPLIKQTDLPSPSPAERVAPSTDLPLFNAEEA